MNFAVIFIKDQESNVNEKECNVKRLLEDVEATEVLNVQWSEILPKRNKLLHPVKAMLDKIRKDRKEIELFFGGKELHETFDFFVNEDFNLKMTSDMNRYAAQKN